MPTCEVVLRCTDPRAEMVRCEFYEAPPWTGLQDRTCVHRSVVPAGDCTHPGARRAAMRVMVEAVFAEVMGELPNLVPPYRAPTAADVVAALVSEKKP